MDAETVFHRTSTQPTGMVRDIWSTIGRLTASLNFFSMIDRLSITVPITRPMGFYASLRHPIRMEVFLWL